MLMIEETLLALIGLVCLIGIFLFNKLEKIQKTQDDIMKALEDKEK